MQRVWSDWERKVLSTFIYEGRISRLPARLKKRMVVLRWLVTQFEPDRRYPHAELNAFLARYHPDTATIRREFIVHGLMQRADDVYWRTDPPASR